MAFSIVRSKLVSTLLNASHSTKIVFPCNLLNRSHTSEPPTLGLHEKPPKGSAFLLGYHSFATVPFVGNLERIPYTRKFCLVPSTQNRDFLEKKLEWDVLPLSDWRVGRVESVARKIIAAMNDGLMLDEAYKINGKVYEPSRREIWEQRTLIWKPVTEHLNGREWDFFVAEYMPHLSFCAASGKIIISAAFLDESITSHQDVMIATLVSYELGVVVAKIYWRWQFMVRFYKILLKSMAVSLSISVIFGVIGITDFLISLPLAVLFGMLWECFRLRRNFAEASYIGLILMASAGYDPRVALLVHQHIWKTKGGLFSTLYSGDKLAKLLERKEAMKEAIEIYEEAEAGKRVRKFV